MNFKEIISLMRLDKPTGIYLLMFPCLFSIFLADNSTFPIKIIIIFMMGSVLMRAAGCIINDIFDKDFDKKVKRTQNRPIASGKVSVKQALSLLGLLLLVSFMLLVTLNKVTIILGLFSIIPVVIYPLMKRVTYYPQVVLGFAFNFGALMGYSAVKGSLEFPAFILYLACVFWTLIYDTIYAHQDKDDDILIGVKSTALKFGDKTKPILLILSVLCISGFYLAGYLAGFSWQFIIFIILAYLQLLWQIITLNISDQANCSYRFKSNLFFAILILLAMIY